MSTPVACHQQVVWYMSDESRTHDRPEQRSLLPSLSTMSDTLIQPESFKCFTSGFMSAISQNLGARRCGVRSFPASLWFVLHARPVACSWFSVFFSMSGHASSPVACVQLPIRCERIIFAVH